MSLLKHLRAVALLPLVATVIIPGVILPLAQRYLPVAGIRWPLIWAIAAGSVCVAAGLTLMVRTIAMFASEGEGTLAPWDPTRKLVVVGIYRRVRNPMISGVTLVLLGEAGLLGSLALLAWALLFFSLNALYIPLSEEPGLVQRFGDAYLEYRRNVPRWIPRLRAWTPPER